VKGSADGFVVTGTTIDGQIVAYTSGGSGGTWRPTASLGQAAAESVDGATIGPGGTVIVVGGTSGGTISRPAVFEEATKAGTVRPVSPTSVAGALVPELAANGLASADGEEIAVGSADGYPAVWRLAPGGGSWTLVSMPSLAPGSQGLSALTSVTHGPAGWLAVGGPGPVVLTSVDGTTWHRAGEAITRDLAGAAPVTVAANPSGYVIVANESGPGSSGPDLWWSPNLTSWTQATAMSDTNASNQVLAVTADSREFMAVGSDAGHPAVWTTTDGKTWTTIVLDLPPGASAAVLQRVAIDGDHVVALGQETTADGTVPFAELSADAGASWQRVRFGAAGTVVTALTGGSGGFTAASQSGEPGQQDAQVWTSATGATWSPDQVGGLSGSGAHEIAALVSSGSAVVGIGSIATAQGDQPVTVNLPAG
jgi:hypothetical protein